jgi:hypothetical protein
MEDGRLGVFCNQIYETPLHLVWWTSANVSWRNNRHMVLPPRHICTEPSGKEAGNSATWEVLVINFNSWRYGILMMRTALLICSTWQTINRRQNVMLIACGELGSAPVKCLRSVYDYIRGVPGCQKELVLHTVNVTHTIYTAVWALYSRVA